MLAGLRIGAGIAIAIALLLVLRPLVLGGSLSAFELVTTSALLTGAGVLLRQQDGRTRTMGLWILALGLVLLAIASTLLVVAVMSCCS